MITRPARRRLVRVAAAAVALAALVVGSGCVKVLPLPEQYTQGGGATAATPNGLIVGTAGEIIDITFPALKTTGWFRQDGQYTFFAGPGDVIPEGVNTSGTVVGWMTTGPSTAYTIAFQWTREGGLTPLPVADPEEMASEAQAINEHGQVVGLTSTLTFPEELSAFLWEAGKPTITLATPAGTYARPLDINDAGEVVGVATNRADQSTLPVLWRPPDYAPVVLPTPTTGLPSGAAVAIDHDGTVVGTAGGVSLRWSPSAGHPYTVIDGLTVTDIDAGNIVGYAEGETGTRPVILEAGETTPEDLGGAEGRVTAIAGTVIAGQSGGQPATFAQRRD